jgi:hypothetical protein
MHATKKYVGSNIVQHTNFSIITKNTLKKLLYISIQITVLCMFGFVIFSRVFAEERISALQCNDIHFNLIINQSLKLRRKLTWVHKKEE